MGLVSELRRRNVLRMAALYVVAAWLIMQVAEVLIDLAELPGWIGRLVLILLAIGFPIALILSWFYEFTARGVELDKEIEAGESGTRVKGRRLDFVVISLLCAAVLMFAYDKWWTGPPPEKSIAVLAFENMSDDPSQEFFSDGISEEILNLLAQLPELTVISRSSAFSFKGKDVSIPEIAAQLNVAHVLEGSVRKSGDRVRVTAQLIEARSDKHLWSETYDRKLVDVFAVQDEIAAVISEALRVKLAEVDGEESLPGAIKTASTEAYDTYLKGRELIHHRTGDELREAIRNLERSISFDNSFAPAHAQLAIATLLYHGYSEEEARRTAFRHLDRAQELEPNLAEAHAGRALLTMRDDAASAVAHARKALAVNPNYIDALTWLRIGLNRLGHEEESHQILERMLVTDPLSVIARLHYAGWLTNQGRIQEAHELADRIIDQSPSAGNNLHAGIAFWDEGKLAEAIYWGLKASRSNYTAVMAFTCVGLYEEARRISGGDNMWIDFNEGRWDDAILSAREQAERNPNSGNRLVIAAEILYRAGHIDEALSLYERAFGLAPDGRSVTWWPSYYAMQLAVARRKAGDEEGAQAAAQMARLMLDKMQAAKTRNHVGDMAGTMVAAFDHDTDRSIEAISSAIERWLRWPQFFDDPVFDDLRKEPRFIALLRELDDILAEEREKTLQLICFNNPIPDEWQPLPETCAGVVEVSSR